MSRLASSLGCPTAACGCWYIFVTWVTWEWPPLVRGALPRWISFWGSSAGSGLSWSFSLVWLWRLIDFILFYLSIMIWYVKGRLLSQQRECPSHPLGEGGQGWDFICSTITLSTVCLFFVRAFWFCLVVVDRSMELHHMGRENSDGVYNFFFLHS